MNQFLVQFLQAAQGGNPYMTFIMLGLMIVVFYFFMIRPQMKRQKELRKFREALKKGDKVVTTGGIYGTVAEIKDDAIMIEIADNVKIKVDKSAVIMDMADANRR
jgi:preprotein translocase subunit YajC